MPATRLATRTVEKVWGRYKLGLGFGDAPEGGEPVGEIWFEGGEGVPDTLLVKYLFTSEKLSVQCHPDDATAQARGHRSGKEECWLILDTEPGATIGIGLKERVSPEELRAAALDGSVENMLDWKQVAPGDIFYLQAGTIHAIGAGVTLLEVQQNVDLTYRLYDYGRPRELHLDEAMGVAEPAPWAAPDCPGAPEPGREILAAGRKFVLERWNGAVSGTLAPVPGRPLWLILRDGTTLLGGERLTPGEVWVCDESAPLAHDGDMLVAYAGSDVAETLIA
ncbi:class I mannose-6-phosphate isomerase [uncultured Parasphingopyxis sp.]|uniref:class I mannose-6-phosphate isomerase n=1 Tax=uncultured Parasphingopyxis sp. TaxID=1547918 RepID=UPI0026150BC3|nr:class I mannose-6-phosphate isomerase [uncultured Parasphingopyxis sp.]